MSLLLPVIEGRGAPLDDHVHAHRDELRSQLYETGAVLLRGFRAGGVDGFTAAVREFSGEPLAYTERTSPRSVIKGNVYTSTDYPPEQEIFLHNENSYQQTWPLVLFFHCIRPPRSQGATPLAGTRDVLAAIDPAVRDEFTRRKWMMVRNFGDDVGLRWHEVFGTTDPTAVERHCAAHSVTLRWGPGGRLQTSAVREAVHLHPVTDQPVWFNHVTVSHVTTLPASVQRGLREMYGDQGLPTNTFYGDGEAIPDDVVAHLRECYRRCTVRFDYQRDDVVLVDNMLTCHGREPFTGPRRVAVAMAEPHSG